MWKKIRYRHLQQVVLAADYLAGCPGQFDFAFSRIRVLRLLHALSESDCLANAVTQFVYRPLVVLVLGRHLP